tara:strand:- start:1342 stop:2658 length:1317 start_codon:yes stop_codon:yes gene_type:complete
MTNATKTTNDITWHNEATAIMVAPKDDAPEAMTSVELTLTAGRTIKGGMLEGKEVKRAGWYIKGVCDGAEYEGKNVAFVINAIVRDKFGGTKFHDVAKAVSEFAFPDIQDEASDEPAENTDWTTFENAAELIAERDAASESASIFFKGESDMRRGLKSLGQHIANVALSLEKPKAFKAWLESGSADLQTALDNKNAKGELIFVGKLPNDWFDAQPESSNSAKSYQRNFNNDKNEIATEAASMAWGKKKVMPKAAIAQKDLMEMLTDYAALPTSKGALAVSMLAHINVASEDGSILFLAEGENGLEAAKDGAGDYIVSTQFGTGSRAHELTLAFCKAMSAATPEAKAEAEERESDNRASAALKPRVFADYGVSEAAMHLGRILCARDDWADVLDALNGMADRADKETWSQVLTDVKDGIDSDAAEAAAEAAETDADDDA